MRALGRALRDLGETFPFPYRLPADIRRGDLVMLLSAPTVGKSTVAVDWAIRVARRGEPVLYVTTDTHIGEQAVRAAANIFDTPKDAIKAQRAQWSERLTGVGYPLRWSSADVTERTIDDLVESEVEYFGEYPALVVVDVAFDLMEGEEGPGTARTVFRTLHSLAGRTGCVVLALHHVKGGDGAAGDTFVGMSDALYRVERVPEVIISAWRPAPGRIAMHLAKNRGGTDGMTETMAIDFDKARVMA
jgi:predicted ATP-dependent serine protease